MSAGLHTFVKEFKRIVTGKPNHIALLDSTGKTLTYFELDKEIEKACTWLGSLGVKPGDKLITVLPNSIETAILALASLLGGYIYAPLPCGSTINEVTRLCNIINPQCCLLTDSLGTMFKQKMTELNVSIEYIEIGREASLWSEHVSNNRVFEGGGGILIASSGSTGDPKGILLDGDRLWSSAVAFLNYHDARNAEMRFWNYLPMSYLGGLFNLLMIPLAAGGSVYVDEAFNGKTFLTFWSTVRRFGINGLWLVPTILRGLMTVADKIGKKKSLESYPNIDYCYLGTAPVSLQEKQAFSETFGVWPIENYGLSETTFISSDRLGDVDCIGENCTGKIMPDVEVRLKPVTMDGNTLNQIWLRTPYMMLGYLDANCLHSPTLDQDGFWYSGDLGYISNGSLVLSGRERDIIKKGGVLIVLREIEELTEAFAGVAEAVAVKTEHDFYGESYDLYIRTLDLVLDVEQFKTNLNVWICEKLIHYKWPEHIIHVNEFPRTNSGKIQKHILSDRIISHV